MSRIIGVPQEDSRNILFRVIEFTTLFSNHKAFAVEFLRNDETFTGWLTYNNHVYDSRNRAMAVYRRILNYK